MELFFKFALFYSFLSIKDHFLTRIRSPLMWNSLAAWKNMYKVKNQGCQSCPISDNLGKNCLIFFDYPIFKKKLNLMLQQNVYLLLQVPLRLRPSLCIQTLTWPFYIVILKSYLSCTWSSIFQLEISSSYLRFRVHTWDMKTMLEIWF